MIKRLKFYKSQETNPYINLGIEKHLLERVDDDTLILYLWQNKNTVVIGKNQNPWAECCVSFAEEDGGFIARRQSGGGAVYHDLGNVNFTFISSKENMDVSRNMQIIQKACEKVGVKTEISGRNDILADGKKFSGNAFYNTKDKAYHHGTILVNADKEKMQKLLTPSKAKLIAKGVKSVTSRVVNLAELSESATCESVKDGILSAFIETFNMSCEAIMDIDMDFVNSMAEEYSSWDFVFGKTIDFSVSLENRFSWGQVQLLLNVKDGIISDIQVFTDAMDSTLSETIEKALKGCKYDLSSVKKRLTNAQTPHKEDIVSLFQNI